MQLQIITLNISHFYHILGDVVLTATTYFPKYCSRFRCPLVFYSK